MKAPKRRATGVCEHFPSVCCRRIPHKIVVIIEDVATLGLSETKGGHRAYIMNGEVDLLGSF